jgi:hypothetical protein
MLFKSERSGVRSRDRIPLDMGCCPLFICARGVRESVSRSPIIAQLLAGICNVKQDGGPLESSCVSQRGTRCNYEVAGVWKLFEARSMLLVSLELLVSRGVGTKAGLCLQVSDEYFAF